MSTPEFYRSLRILLDAECAGLTDEEAVAYLNEPGAAVLVRPTMVTERGLYAQLGPATAEPILQALEAAAEVDPVVRRALKWLAPPSDGIDLGDAYTRGMLDQLVAAEVLTADQAAVLKALAESPATLAEYWLLGRPHLGDVQNARALEV